MSKLKYYTGSAWVEVPDGDAVKYRSGSAWVSPAKLAYYRGGSWHTAWSRLTTPASDPQTYQHFPTDSASYRPSGWRTGSGIYQASFGFGDHIGCMAFDYLAIKTQLDARPMVTSARLKLQRSSSAHGDASAVVMLWSLGGSAVTTGNLVNRSSSPLQPNLLNGSKETGTVVYDRGDYLWEPISTSFIDRFRLGATRGLACAESETLADPGVVNTNYAIFSGYNQTNKPILEFTCDFT